MCLTASGDVSQLVRLMCLTFPMREKSVTEQRYEAVLGVISEDPLQNETHNRIGRATNQPELLRGALVLSQDIPDACRKTLWTGQRPSRGW